MAELERSVKEYEKLIRLLKEENERLKRGLLGRRRNDSRPTTRSSHSRCCKWRSARSRSPRPMTPRRSASLRSTRENSRNESRSLRRCSVFRSRSCRSRCRERASTPSISSAPTCERCSSVAPHRRSSCSSSTRSSCARITTRVRRRSCSRPTLWRCPSRAASPARACSPNESSAAGQDHQPLNRLEGIYGREGLDLARSTICTWH